MADDQAATEEATEETPEAPEVPAKLTPGHVKALRDKLGDDLADFFAHHHGVEGDDVPDDDADDGKKRSKK